MQKIILTMKLMVICKLNPFLKLIHSYNKYLLTTYSVPDAVLDMEGNAVMISNHLTIPNMF